MTGRTRHAEALKPFNNCDGIDLIRKITTNWIDLNDEEHIEEIVNKLDGDYTMARFLIVISDGNIINSIKNKDDVGIPISEQHCLSLVRSFMNQLQNEWAPIFTE